MGKIRYPEIKRICSYCGTNKTVIHKNKSKNKKGSQIWCFNNTINQTTYKILCYKCYSRMVTGPRYRESFVKLKDVSQRLVLVVCKVGCLGVVIPDVLLNNFLSIEFTHSLTSALTLFLSDVK